MTTGTASRSRPRDGAAGTHPPLFEQHAHLQIVYRPLDDLKPLARNARTHGKKQIEKLRASLGRFGWTNPLLIAENSIIAGHGRLAAAIAMRAEHQPIRNHPWPDLAPSVDLSHLAPAERRAYALADNRLAEDAGWDQELLRIEFTDLQEIGLNLDVTGFEPVQIDTLLGTDRSRQQQAIKAGMQFQIILDCEGEVQQAELLAELRGKNLKCRPLIL